ncbi:MAG: DUF3006 domain-containing protein [Clostridia bacterium]|nr:DUF3006 domain-containing protein [Clostridia bacterium]
MRWSYDRREGDIAVLVDEQGNSCEIAVNALPSEAVEGMLLRQTDSGFVADGEATEARRRQVLSLQERLLGRGKR